MNRITESIKQAYRNGYALLLHPNRDKFTGYAVLSHKHCVEVENQNTHVDAVIDALDTINGIIDFDGLYLVLTADQTVRLHPVVCVPNLGKARRIALNSDSNLFLRVEDGEVLFLAKAVDKPPLGVLSSD
jgi:hypothetical protein